jgi:hypothetical protein
MKINFDLKVYPAEARYKQKLLNYINRTEGIRDSKQLLNFEPIRIRIPGRPLKRLQDG